MDFALLPPEVNSGRMYSGAGAGPMLAAASSWDALGAELNAAGLAYEAVLTELSTVWTGPSATAMTAAAAPYAQWMRTAAIQAEETAIQARAATAAYESAFAMTVPPPVIAANRSLLMTLVATNFLGQNTPAIAATEAHYAQMWAQDAAAMYGYSAGAAAATRLVPFTQPPRTTNSAAATGQAGHAVGQAAGHAGHAAGHAVGHAGHAAGHVGHAAGHAGHASGHAAGHAAGHASGHIGHAAGHAGHASGHAAGHASGHIGHASAIGHAAATAANGQGGGVGAGGTPSATFPTAAGASAGASALAGVIGPAAASASAPAIELSNAGLELVVDSAGTFGIDALGTFLIDPLGVFGVTEELFRAAMAGAMPVTASLASATSLSGLSVPLSWASAAPVLAQQVGMSLAAAGTSTGASASPAVGGAVVPAVGMAAAGVAGRAGASAAGGRRAPTAGTTTPPPASRRPEELPELPVESAFGLLMGADVELRELAELRNAGILTDEEYRVERRALVGR